MRWKKECGAAGDEEASLLTEMGELLGTRFNLNRYCEPTKMAAPEKYNDVKKNALQFCVQGTFTPEGFQRGQTDTRWQSLEQLTESCSREDFERLFKAHLKDLEKSFKRDAKRFKTAAQLEEE